MVNPSTGSINVRFYNSDLYVLKKCLRFQREHMGKKK